LRQILTGKPQQFLTGLPLKQTFTVLTLLLPRTLSKQILTGSLRQIFTGRR
jgi:hypothetical protein